jgi:UDP-N-acetyl-D-mannosaminuronic acid dehydrogenase
LSFKLRKLLQLEARRVLCHDPYAASIPDSVSLEQLLTEADVLFVAAPHPEYRGLAVPAGRTIIDVWDILAKPARAEAEAPATAFKKVSV